MCWGGQKRAAATPVPAVRSAHIPALAPVNSAQQFQYLSLQVPGSLQSKQLGYCLKVTGAVGGSSPGTGSIPKINVLRAASSPPASPWCCDRLPGGHS